MSVAQLKATIEKLKNLKEKVSKEADRIVQSESESFALYNALQLSKTGLDSDDKPLRYGKKREGVLNSSGAYTKAYDRYKRKLGGQTTYIDLNLSGEFQRGIKLEQVERNYFIFVSEVEYEKYLRSNYGDAILGINEKNLDKISHERIEPQLQYYVDKLFR